MNWQDPKAPDWYKPAEALTGFFARPLIKQAGLDHASGTDELIILDNACGTGILSVHLYATLPAAAKQKLQLTCGDISPPMLRIVQDRIKANGWEGASTKVVDAQKMDLPSNHFTHVLTNFGVVGIPDPHALLRECLRVLRPAGTCALTIWQHTGWYGYAEAAVNSLPDAPAFPSWTTFANSLSKHPGDQWENIAFAQQHIEACGFEDVEVNLVPNQTKHESAEAFCNLFGGMVNVVLGNFWTEEERKRMSPLVVPAMAKVLKEKFGDGEIVLDWAAWCVTAKKPAEKQ